MFTDAWRKGFWQLWGHESWKRIHASESLDFESFHASESLDFESFHAQLWEFRFWALPCFWEFRAFSFERFRSFENWGKFQMETGMCAFTTGADYTLLNVAQTLGHIRDIHDTHTHIYTYIYIYAKVMSRLAPQCHITAHHRAGQRDAGRAKLNQIQKQVEVQ